MTRIDFYISPQSEELARYHVACKLTEKAYKLGNKVYIHTESSEQARQIDDLLWTFRDGSFIPHQTCSQDSEKSAPVLIGHDKDLPSEADILINLAQDIPDFFSQFDRVAELVNENPDARVRARERYKFYRDRGYELNTYNL